MEGDKFLQILGFLYFLATTCYCQVQLTADNEQVNVGDDVILTCNVKNFKGGQVVRWDRIYLSDDNNQKTEVEIAEEFASNIFLADLFKNAGIDRYVIGQEALGGDAYNLILTITGIKIEDSGTFECTHQETGEKSRVKVDVLVQPKTISLMVDGEKKEDGTEIEMEAGDKRDIKCVVGGSNPEPEVSMFLGRKQDGSDGKAVTNFFDTTFNTEYVSTDDNIKSLRTPSATTKVTAKQLEITGSYGNRFLVCKGALKNGATTTLTSSVYIKFQGAPPEIECSNSVTSFKGQTNFNVTCSVTAEEKPSIHFVRFLEKGNYTLELDEKKDVYGNYRYIIEKEKNGNKYFMILKMDRVTPQMFRKYTFVAGNDFGSDSHDVTLERNTSLEKDVSSSPSVSATISSVIFCLTIAALLGFFN